jgi:malonyl-CoA decarboxylase
MWCASKHPGNMYHPRVASGDDDRLEGPELEVLRTTSLALLAVRSEASSRALADLVVRRYRALDSPARLEYLRFVSFELGPDVSAVKSAVAEWQSTPTEDNLWRLSCALEAPRQALFQAISGAERGTQTVVDMRGDVLSNLGAHVELVPMERDLHHVLSSWFGRGLIELHRIKWDSPARILEKIIAYEAVHEIAGWEDLRRRLESDRRCYGFFHPAMAHEPLIFVEVALTQGMVTTIGEVLQAPSIGDNPLGPVDTATFYSISNCQLGLSGIPLGDFLVKQVAGDLAHELPELRRFVTLSPIPGFRAWLDHLLRHRHRIPPEDVTVLAALGNADWPQEADIVARLRSILERLCAIYLLTAKRGNQAVDPVARFHLRNGASILRINWMADSSVQGMRQSAGLMVSYEYDEAHVATNHEAYVLDGVVAHSAEIARILNNNS